MLCLRATTGPDEFPDLVAIWRSAVDATHDFLAAKDREEIERRLPVDYLPNVRLTVAEVDGKPVGFAGTAERRLEMLFVAADRRGQGIGTALLSHVISTDAVTLIEANEQNGAAVRFYRARGFEVVGRRELDDAGRPYPVLAMKLIPDRDSR